jgi:tetratricopeptide (TPR) repeat protein
MTWRILARAIAPAMLFMSALAAPGSTAEPAASGSAHNLVEQALNEAYNSEYGRAQRDLETWLRTHPNDIRALNYLADDLLNRQMLQENLFNGSAYLNGGRVFTTRKAPLPAGFTQRLNAVLDKAQAIEEARLKRNSRDENALYWLGVTHGTRTEFDFILLRSYFAALHEGKTAWRYHQKLLRIDPSYTDAYFIVGLGRYTLGILPWYFRVVTSLLGARGNVKQGIADLERVSREGHYVRVDAQIVLVAINERQKNYSQALALLDGLEQAYPKNYLAPLEIARIDKVEGNWRAAAEVYDATVKKFVNGDQVDPRPIPKAEILYRAGEAHEHLEQLTRALEFFHEAGRVLPKSLEVYQADFAAARLDQRLNRTATAKQEYQAVAAGLPDSAMGKASRQALRSLH